MNTGRDEGSSYSGVRLPGFFGSTINQGTAKSVQQMSERNLSSAEAEVDNITPRYPCRSAQQI